MAQIMTVRGPIAPLDLGATYAHDHLLAAPPPWSADARDQPNMTMTGYAEARQELLYFRMAGGGALVEMSTPDYGRQPAQLRRLAEETGVHIIMTTGLHKDDYSAPITGDTSIDDMAERFSKDLLYGAEDSDIRAGVIKAATGYNSMTAGEEKVLRAAARAHHASGAPISTHTQGGTLALEQIAVLREEGVDPQRIAIGHVDRKLEYEYHRAILATGAYIIYDQISKENYYPDSRRISVLKQLIADGYARRILFSGDFGRTSYFPSYGGGPGFTYILWRFVPWLISEGVSAETTRAILVDNPARFFAL